MGADGTLNLAPINLMATAGESNEPFHGGSVKNPAQLQFTAAGRNEILNIWTGRGLNDRPPALKPLRDGKVLGLALCGLDVPGRVLLKWRKQGKEVGVNLFAVLPLFDIRVPKGQLMDMGLTVHTDQAWGKVLVCNLETPPFRPQKRRGSRNQTLMPADTVGT